jgi:two-component system KDP operon response regulator KdpE
MSEQRKRVRPGANGVVLLVEDNEDARTIYGTYLRRSGYEVIEAPTLAAASAAYDARRPDVIVLDRGLPDGDGLDLARKWRRHGQVPIVMVTASGQRADVEEALFAGCDAFLTKPCPGDVLALHVDRAMLAARPTKKFAAVRPRSDPPPGSDPKSH